MATVRSRLKATFAGALLLPTASFAAGLNDTGQTQCYDATNARVPCSSAVGGDAGVNPRQDGRYGRDAQATVGLLTKIGAGVAGFDYTKIGNNGTPLFANAVLGGNASDWACTKDNVTGLTWEVKTTSGLRSKDHTYTWYSTAATNGGYPGSIGSDTCGGTLAAAPYSNQCNTQNYVAAVNAATLCGSSDWRVPLRRELLSLVHAAEWAPTLDRAYFPNTNTTIGRAWSSSSVAFFAMNKWAVDFIYGTSSLNDQTGTFVVRLVRGAP